MLRIGDKFQTPYGTATFVGSNNDGVLIFQFYESENLPALILENKHGKGYWLQVKDISEIEQLGKE